MKTNLTLATSSPENSKTPLLDRVAFPEDLRHFGDNQLKRLADELRSTTIDVVSKIGGHLGASLGVVELTVALHAVFNTPEDRLIWDVGHQAYPHKRRIHCRRWDGHSSRLATSSTRNRTQMRLRASRKTILRQFAANRPSASR